jgi:hypothetical protein
VAKKSKPKFELTPQLIGIAVALLIAGLAAAWYFAGDAQGPDTGEVPDIRDTKKSM